MTKVLSFKPRQMEVRAMRIILGATTRTQIIEFCPSANVGCSARHGVLDETDIRWIYISNGTDAVELSADGEWLVQLSDGAFEFLSDTEFHARYEFAE